MKNPALLLALLCIAALSNAASGADPLRVFIRGGKKSHGPNAHEHERFLTDWKILLAERGIKSDGAMDWPTSEQFKNTDVVIVHAQEGGNVTAEQKADIEEFIKRGGGLVVLHAAAVSNDPPWWKQVIGGAWVPGTTKWKEGMMDLYYTENQRLEAGHPITLGASNFRLDDEIYFDMAISPEARVLATSYTPKLKNNEGLAPGGKAHIYDIQPQMWAYERKAEGGTRPYRAFVSIPGHLYGTFEKPQYRAILMRAIAWAGNRTDINEFARKEELEALTYPEGGPQRPADTLAKLEIHPDFSMKLVASEPLISKPMNFDWDPAGRLWVAETPEYPNGRRGMRPDYRGKEWKEHGGIDPVVGQQSRKAIDKISILSDSKGDGVMDKKSVFYEGLDLVTGLIFYKDGVIVTQAPDILWIRDTDQDGKADKVEKLYTGLGKGDTHAVINNPRWGWDGWIYCTHGYSGSRDVTNGDGTQHFGAIGSGVVRFKPDGSAFEQYSSKGGNTWGLTVTGDNRIMWTQPTSGQLLMQTVLPEYALARGKVANQASFKVVIPSPKSFPAMTWKDMAYAQIDWVGSFTAAAGAVCYDGGTWPAEYNGDYFTTEPTINILHHERLTPEGASYTGTKLPGREQTEFVRSSDMWWRPIEVRVGPDGAMYVGDFYNQAVIHNDTRGPDHNGVNAAVRPDRDHYFGRIWRVDHKQAKSVPVPNLSTATPKGLAAALAHSNRSVRMSASRLLIEKAGDPSPVEKVYSTGNAEARIAALWTLRGLGAVKTGILESAFADAESAVRRNAALVAESMAVPSSKALVALLQDPDAQVRVAALRAMAAGKLDDAAARTLIAAWPKFDDGFQQSAAIGAAASSPIVSIRATFDSAQPAALIPLVSQLTAALGAKNDLQAAAELLILLAGKPASQDGLKQAVLEGLGQTLQAAPPMSPQLVAALGQLIESGVGSSALGLALKWDGTGAFAAQAERMMAKLTSELKDVSKGDAERLATATSLLGLQRDKGLNAVVELLAGPASSALKRNLLTALGQSAPKGLAAALVPVYGKLVPEAQAAAFEVLLQRAEWTQTLLGAIKSRAIPLSLIGPGNLARLRTHPDKAVAKEANVVLGELLGPVLAAKNEILAKLTPLVEQPGDPVKGRALFTTSCAICHRLGDLGADVGPALTGMGSHGPAQLLVHIVDPNREVDPSFATWNIQTRTGQFYSGIVARENPSAVTLKSLAGAVEIKTSDIQSRVNTGLSLMPEGLEALGAETLRDILSFICGADANHVRTLDLSEAFTTSTRNGLYASMETREDTLTFKKFGISSVEGIPFQVVDPDRATNGKNIIVLKGGPAGSYSKTLPQRVEIKVGGFTANRLHFLGGVTGWGFRGGETASDVLRVTVLYSDGKNEQLVFKDGVEFSDYYGDNPVPGSKSARELLKGHQVRFFTRALQHVAPIERLVIESLDTGAAPTLVAITAELGAGDLPAVKPVAAPAPAPVVEQALPQPPDSAAVGMRVLLVGGGSSHDFAKWYGQNDRTTLGQLKPGWIDYTENANGGAAVLARVDVLGWSANQPVASETCAALLQFAESGKGMVILHPGTWYAWKNFPDWNRQIVGGGARGHDPFGEFEVEVLDPKHPLTAGLPAKFRISDELYQFVPDPSGAHIRVLAQATSPITGKTFPQVWVVEHPKSRVVCITLGHDGKAHDLPEYQRLLKNAFTWAAGK